MNTTHKGPEKDVSVSQAQLRYLEEGVNHVSGKLPLFDENGEIISESTINAVVKKGLAEPAYARTFLKDMNIFRITDKGREIVLSYSTA